jgi:hypothetical protein
MWSYFTKPSTNGELFSQSDHFIFFLARASLEIGLSTEHSASTHFDLDSLIVSIDAACSRLLKEIADLILRNTTKNIPVSVL